MAVYSTRKFVFDRDTQPDEFTNSYGRWIFSSLAATGTRQYDLVEPSQKFLDGEDARIASSYETLIAAEIYSKARAQAIQNLIASKDLPEGYE